MAHLRFFREFCGTRYPAPERMFYEHRLTYAHCFSRHSYSAIGLVGVRRRQACSYFA